MELSDEQNVVFSKYLSLENIFMTGGAGTGKTFLIRKIYEDAVNKKKLIQVCALTGCSALLLECHARTIHSWAGIGICAGSVDEIVDKVSESYSRFNWMNIQILIIDECSMMNLKLFNILNRIAKKVRRNTNPFGGIQVIFSADFYQLPPIGDKEGDPDTEKFCFESLDFYTLFSRENRIELLKNFRQKDQTLLKILNEIRTGDISTDSIQILNAQVEKEIPENVEIKPVKLFPLRRQVEYINNLEMNKLEVPEIEFEIEYKTNLKMTKKEEIKRSKYRDEDITRELSYMKTCLLCESTLKLKLGAQVMLIRNMDLPNGDYLCNGSQGKIKEFTEFNVPIIQFESGIVMPIRRHTWTSGKIPGIGVSQIPLIISYALTIHKTQGSTLERAEIDCGDTIFAPGQIYVAMSRLKTLDGLTLLSFEPKKIFVNKKVQEFYDKFQKIL